MVRMTLVLAILVSGLTADDFAIRPFSRDIYFQENWTIDFVLDFHMDLDYSEDGYMADLYDMFSMDMGIDVISLTSLSCRPGFSGAFDILKRYESMDMRIRGEMFGVDFEELMETPMYEEAVDSIVRETLRDSVVVYNFSPRGEFLGGTFGGEDLTTDPGNPWNAQDPFASGLFLLLEPQEIEPGNTWTVTRDTSMDIADFGRLEMRSDAVYTVAGTQTYQGYEVLRIDYENIFKSKTKQDESMEYRIDDFSGSDRGYILYDVEFGLPVKVETKFFFTGRFSDDEGNNFDIEATAFRHGNQIRE